MEKLTQKVRIRTPRMVVNVHTIYSDIVEARKDGWDVWFTYNDDCFLSRDNQVGAIVRRGRNV